MHQHHSDSFDEQSTQPMYALAPHALEWSGNFAATDALGGWLRQMYRGLRYISLSALNPLDREQLLNTSERGRWNARDNTKHSETELGEININMNSHGTGNLAQHSSANQDSESNIRLSPVNLDSEPCNHEMSSKFSLLRDENQLVPLSWRRFAVLARPLFAHTDIVVQNELWNAGTIGNEVVNHIIDLFES